MTTLVLFGRLPVVEAALYLSHHDGEPADRTCPICGTWWDQGTPRAWWLRWDRCYSCQNEALGNHDGPTSRMRADVEAWPFELGAS